jgi:hypothetical protein
MSPRERQAIHKNESYNSVVSLEEAALKDSKKSVSFGSVQIREYNRLVGDHPDVRVGPPLTISWEYGVRQPIAIDEYEQNRPAMKKVLRMSSITRKNLLLNVFDIPEEEIRDAEKEVQRIRKSREYSIKQGKPAAVIETSFRRAGRKLRKNLWKSLSATSQLMVPGGSTITAY